MFCCRRSGGKWRCFEYVYDGVTETTGDNREEFGEARLLETLRKSRDLEATTILRNVEDAVEQFRLGEQQDDLTLVIARAR